MSTWLIVLTLLFKKHLCGVGIVYEPIQKSEGRAVALPSLLRPNGSLFSRQKRSIADACEWLRLSQTRSKKALIFCLTSPGHTHMANAPKFISKFIDNMKANYGLCDYVWVREHTKKGHPHFHFVAHWHDYKWFLDKRCVICDKTECTCMGNKYSRIHSISKYWSGLFGSESMNSIRLGSYYNKKRVGFYLTTEKHAWYLTKYLGKSIGDANNSYLCEAGFPQTIYRKTTRAFGMSEQVSMLSEPDIFESDYEVASWRKVDNLMTKEKVVLKQMQRVWKAQESDLTIHKGVSDLVLNDALIAKYDWRWTGHGETYLGFDKERTAKGRKSLKSLIRL